MTWQKNYFSSENQPWTRQVEREVDNLKSNFRSAEVNNTTRDDQLASSLRQVSQATIQAQAAADDAQDAADAALAAATTANNALNGLVSLGTDGSTYNVHGGNITANTITATEISSTYVYAGTLSATQITTGTLSANFISGGTISGTNVNVTNLNASNITAGSLSVDRIGTGTLPVGIIYAGTLSATQITTGTLSANFISGGTISGTNVNITNLSASNIVSGTMSANRISGGTIDASLISVTNLNASNITTGTLSADYIFGGTIDGTEVTVTNLNASNITAGSLSVSRIGSGTLPVGVIYAGNISATQITTGTLSANFISGGTISGTNVNITNLNASNISSGSLNADFISGGTIDASNISGVTISGTTITGGSISGTTITGSTLTSANSGRRVVIEATSTSYYDENNNFTGRILGAGTDRGATLELTSGASGELQIWNGGVIMYGAAGTYAALSDNGFGVGGNKLYTISQNIEAIGGSLITDTSLRIGATTLTRDGTGRIESNGGYLASGPLGVTGNFTYIAPTETGTMFPLYWNNSTNRVYRLSSSERYKTNIQDAVIDYSALLSAKVRTFKNKQEVEEFGEENAALTYGYIAEELDALGLTDFVVYDKDEDGNLIPESVNYMSISLAQHELIKSLEARLKALEDKVK